MAAKKKKKAAHKGTKSAKAKMAHVRSFKGKGHKKTKKSSRRAHAKKMPSGLAAHYAKKAHSGLAARYHSTKRAYHSAGLDLFKSRHGGLTPKEWNKKHRKAKHKGKGR